MSSEMQDHMINQIHILSLKMNDHNLKVLEIAKRLNEKQLFPEFSDLFIEQAQISGDELEILTNIASIGLAMAEEELETAENIVKECIH